MKMKLLLVALLAVSVGMSAAVAAPPPGKGKPPAAPNAQNKPPKAPTGKGKPKATGEGCKPKVTVVLKGTLAATPGESPSALSVMVSHANRHGWAYVGPTPTSVLVDEDTKVRREGKKALGDLLMNDRVLVQARACKADLAEGETPALTATRVVAHPAA
jgi:hypothetical protein